MHSMLARDRVSRGAWLCAALSVLLLAACGGGGGGGGSSPPPPSLTFTPDKTSISFSATQGLAPPSTTITITATGTYNGTLYVAATASAPGLAASIPIVVTGTTAVATVTAANGLAAGTYNGTLTLMACSDAACANQIGNSPLKISYSVTVAPTLEVTPATLAVTALSGAPATANLAIQLPQGQTAFSASVTSGLPWLSVQATGATAATVGLASLPSGTYTGTLQVSSGNFAAGVPVTYTVTPPAGGDHPLTTNPTSLTLSTVEDATTSAALAVTPPSWSAPVSATVEYPSGPSGWLTLAQTASGYTANASAVGLTAGSYTANVRLKGAYPQQDVLVPVALTVGVGLVRPADASVTVNAETQAAALSTTTPVAVAAGPPVTFSAQSDSAWLVLANATGTTGGSFTWTIDAAQLIALGNAADHVAHVTITPGLTTMTPVTFAITLHEQLPQATSLAPAVQLSSALNPQVVVRGSGFAAIANSVLRFAVDGHNASVLAAMPVNDTEVRLTLGTLTAGVHTVSVSNALGLTTTTTKVTAAPSPAYSYAAIATNGALRSLAYDPARDAILAANTTQGQVLRFAHGSGATWTASSAPLANVYDTGLSTDHATLLASTTSLNSSTLVALDPVTLGTQGTANLSGASPAQFIEDSFTYLGFGIPATNDGRSWLALSSMWSGSGTGIDGVVSYVVPPGLSPVALPLSGISTLTSGGPWYTASRNGERLLIVQSAQVTPQPPMLYLDAADGVVHVNPANLTFSTYLSLSDDAGKMLFDNLTLRDGSFNPIGTATLPGAPGAATTYYPAASQVSPDGSLVYVFAYRNDASSNAAVTPRVYVFSSSATAGVLNELGHFDVPDYPSCTLSAVGCVPVPLATAISLDGQTLFVAGDQKLLVIPKPASLTPLGVSASPSAKTQRRSAVTTPWPLNVR